LVCISLRPVLYSSWCARKCDNLQVTCIWAHHATGCKTLIHTLLHWHHRCLPCQRISQPALAAMYVPQVSASAVYAAGLSHVSGLVRTSHRHSGLTSLPLLVSSGLVGTSLGSCSGLSSFAVCRDAIASSKKQGSKEKEAKESRGSQTFQWTLQCMLIATATHSTPPGLQPAT
jgi:hypothetical protein